MFKIFWNLFLVACFLSSCGIKGKPLPPETPPLPTTSAVTPAVPVTPPSPKTKAARKSVKPNPPPPGKKEF